MSHSSSSPSQAQPSSPDTLLTESVVPSGGLGATIPKGPEFPGRGKLNPRWKRAGKLLAGFISVQFLIQVMMVITGLLLVRTMNKTEYAFFTIANTMQATITLLADVGVSSALNSTGGRVWRDNYRFGQLIRTGLHTRRKLSVIANLVIIPVMVWMLHSKDAPLLAIAVMCALVVVSSNLQLGAGVLTVVPRLRTSVAKLNQTTFLPTVLRLVLTLATCYFLPYSWVAVAIVALSFAVQYYLLERWANREVEMVAPINREDEAFIWKIVRQQSPSSIYYCLYGQLSLFLMALVGTTGTIAEVGALSRFSTLFVVFNTLLFNFAVPRFARVQERSTAVRSYLQITALWVALNLALLLVTWAALPWILALLGSRYDHLRTELMIYMAGAAAASIVNTMGALNRARAWVSYSWVYIPVSICWTVLLLLKLDMAKTRDAVLFGALFFVPALLINSVRALYSFRHWEKHPQTSTTP